MAHNTAGGIGSRNKEWGPGPHTGQIEDNPSEVCDGGDGGGDASQGR